MTFVLLAALIVVLFTKFGGNLPGTLLTYGNADILYPEHYVRDLLSGANWRDWWNTQAPYFFPDMLLLSALVASGTEMVQTSILYTLVSALGFFAAWSAAAWSMGLRGWRLMLGMAAAALVSCLCLWGEHGNPHSWIYTLTYVHLSGHHGGYGLLLPLAAWLTAHNAWRPHAGWAVALGALASLLFLSDMLFAFAFAGPAALWLGMLWRCGTLPPARFWRIMGIFVAAFLISRLFGLLTPYPGDQAFLEYVFQHWPNSVGVSLRQFGHDLPHYYFSLQGSSGWLGFGFLASGIYLIRWLTRQDWRTLPEPALLMAELLALSATLGFFFVLLPQLGLGVYVSNANSRQFAALLPLGWMSALLIWLRRRPDPRRFTPSMLGLAGLGVAMLLLALGFARGGQESKKSFTSHDRALQCFAQLMETRGLRHVVTDYWIARPLWFAGQGRLSGVPSNPDLAPFLNAANVTKIWQETPEGVLVWDETSRKEALRLFGAPQRIDHCPRRDGQEQASLWRLYDYRGNARLAQWSKRADTLHFEPGGNRAEVVASSLAVQSGQARMDGTGARFGERDGVLEDGQFIRLSAGDYQLRFHLRAPAPGARLKLRLRSFSLTGEETLIGEWNLQGDASGVLQTGITIPASAGRQSKMLNYRFESERAAIWEKLEIIRLR